MQCVKSVLKLFIRTLYFRMPQYYLNLGFTKKPSKDWALKSKIQLNLTTPTPSILPAFSANKVPSEK